MRLLHLEIENFGKLSGYEQELTDGMNLLCEKNGWGKSTLAVFIKAMLYGLPASTKRSLDRNERKKYAPWQGGSYGGSLSFACDRGCFRVERFFGAKEADDEFRLFDLSTNKPSTAFSANLGVELLGIDADGFERSTYLSQRSVEGGDNDSITAKLTGLLEDVNDIGSFEGAMESIDRRRKFYEVKGGRGRVSDLQQELSARSAELEECRRALPIQAEREDKLALFRTQMLQTKAEKEQLQKQLQAAERKTAHLEECERTRRRIRADEEERRALLQSFADQRLPTDGELAEARAWLSAVRSEQTARQAYAMTEAEEAAEQQLLRRYPNGLPAPLRLDMLQDILQSSAECKARLQALPTLTETREQKRFAATGIPAQALLDEATEKLNRAEQLQKGLQALSAQPEPKASKGSLGVWTLPACLAALACCIASFVFKTYRIPLLIAAALLTGVGALCFFRGRSKRQADKAAKAAKQEQLSRESDTLTRFVNGVLQAYGYSTPQAAPRTAITELTFLAARAREDHARMENRNRQKQALTQQAEQCRQQLQEALGALGATELPADPQAALLQARADVQEWSRLTAKKREIAEKTAESDTKIADKQEKLTAFLGRLTVRESRKPEECLLRMEQLSARQADLLGQITRDKKELQLFMEENGITDGSTPPDTAALHEQDATRNRRMEALQQQEDAVRRELERITAQTQRIPELEDQVAYLTAQAAEAQENLRILRHTADFLDASREALSTRYLEGMQQHFTHYLSLTEENRIPAASLNTSFDISVKDGGRSRELESYSRGSRDILAFCARLSLVRAMFPEGEKPFLLLDDPFVNLDEEHLAAARALLDRLSEQMQILYLVCHAGRK